MNYENIYNIIILRAGARQKEQGLENHHIIPRSCGGSNAKDNTVFLTTREHFICHRLLVKIYKNNVLYRKKMIYALWWMAKTRNNVNGYRVTSRMYAATRALFIKNSPSRDAATKLKFINNYKAGLYKSDYKKVSHSMKLYIKTLSKDALRQRMKNSVQTCNQIKRADAIRKGKASKFLLVTTDKKNIEFWSYNNVLEITGYKYSQVLYRIKQHNGVLVNGATVQYIEKYRGNDGNIGRKRSNSLGIKSSS